MHLQPSFSMSNAAAAKSVLHPIAAALPMLTPSICIKEKLAGIRNAHLDVVEQNIVAS